MYTFKTLDKRDVTIRKIVFDGFHRHFLKAAHELEEEKQKAKANGGRRKSSVPSTVRGAALTVGGMLDNVKEYNEELTRKKRRRNNGKSALPNKLVTKQ